MDNTEKKKTVILDGSGTGIAAEAIKNGKLVVFPTETVYGLGANALDGGASRRIYEAKGRPSDNPLICHLSNARDAEKYCITNELYYKITDMFAPGPVTVVLGKKHADDGTPVIPDTTSGGLDTVAVRIPSNPIARDLIEKSGVPIAAPSANLSGSPSPTTLAHVIADMDGRADYIIDGGDSEIGLESTIVYPDGDVIRLLRPGRITVEMLSTIAPVEVDPAVTGKSDARPLAPGMKYRHYAPKSKVVILDGDDGKVYAYLEGVTDCAVICFDEDMEKIKCERKISLGGRDDQLSHAHRLFAALRELDGAGTIYSRMPPGDGVGMAVVNRLIKAAGFDVKKL